MNRPRLEIDLESHKYFQIRSRACGIPHHGAFERRTGQQSVNMSYSN